MSLVRDNCATEDYLGSLFLASRLFFSFKNISKENEVFIDLLKRPAIKVSNQAFFLDSDKPFLALHFVE